MLSRFDDYPIHQTAEPMLHPAPSDRNFFDRYFFNGYTRDGSLFFAVALGVYPNRRVMDAAFSVVHGGRQISLHASRLAVADRHETRVGPIAVEVVEPLRTLRVRVHAPESALEADLRFTARGPAVEEPRFTRHVDHQVWMDMTRMTQFGRWEGSLEAEGRRFSVERNATLGCRDRSWGVRPVGEREAGAPGAPLQFFWLWAPIHFDDVCTHLAVNEDDRGRPWHASGVRVPVEGATPGGEIERMRSVAHRVSFEPGTRRARHARLELVPFEGEAAVVELEPILTFQMVGLGYLHPEWGHGMWKGELATHVEAWKLDECPPLDPRFLHVQQLCRARLGERRGLGVLEQLVLGPHRPYGFTGLLDPAPSR